MRPGWTKKNGKKYRYYICINMDKHSKDVCPVRRISAGKAEEAVMKQLRAILQRPEIVAHTTRTDLIREANLTERDVRRHLSNLDSIWDHLFPVEQSRIVGLLFESICVGPKGIDMVLRSDGLSGLMAELTDGKECEKILGKACGQTRAPTRGQPRGKEQQQTQGQPKPKVRESKRQTCRASP
jgi:hypothetical protein